MRTEPDRRPSVQFAPHTDFIMDANWTDCGREARLQRRRLGAQLIETNYSVECRNARIFTLETTKNLSG